MPSELIFELDDVRVTPYIAQFGGTSYQVASIGSVRIVRGKKLNPFALILFVLGVGLFFIAIARSSGSPQLADANFPLAVAAAGVMLASPLLQLAWPGRLYKLLLRIHSGDVEALSSSQAKFVADVKQAIEAAFIARSQRHDEKTNV
jgi:hypothetical protein